MHDHISTAARAGRPWIKPMARIGYAARGLVYLVIGWLTFLSGIGSGGETTDSEGAVQTLMASGPGTVIAVALIFGLLSYAIWRFLQAGLDPDDHGTSAKGVVVRLGLAASGITYLGLTAYTFSIWRGSSSESDNAGALAQWVTGVIGSTAAAFALAAILAGVGGAHFFRAWKRSYERYLDLDQEAMTRVAPVAMAGLFARGAIFFVLAILLFYRGTIAGDGGRPGTEDALNFINGLPFGNILLVLTGIGLIAYAIYSFVQSAWRKVDPLRN